MGKDFKDGLLWEGVVALMLVGRYVIPAKAGIQRGPYVIPADAGIHGGGGYPFHPYPSFTS